MGKALLIVSALSLLPLAAARAEALDLKDLFNKVTRFAESLAAPTPRHAEVRLPDADIDPKMALVPGDFGRMRIIAPPGSPGGDRRVDPR